MKQILTILLSFFSLALIAQNTWQYGISYSQDYAYRQLTTLNHDTINDYIAASSNEKEIYKPAFTTGVNLSYSIKRLSIMAGVFYSNKGYRTKEMNLTFGDHIDERKGFIGGPGEPSSNILNGPIRLIYTLSSIDIPLNVKYTFGKKRLRYFVSAGLAANIFFQKKTTLKNIETKEKNVFKEKYNKVNFSPQVSVGLSYALNEKMNLRLEPIYRYTIKNTWGADNIRQNLFSYGLNLSVFRSF